MLSLACELLGLSSSSLLLLSCVDFTGCGAGVGFAAGANGAEMPSRLEGEDGDEEPPKALFPH